MDTTFDDRAGAGKARPGLHPRLQAGVTLNDRYQIDELIGSSVYGEVYRGRDLSDGRLVNIKAIAPHLIADATLRQRLEREIQIAVQLDHKNVGTTYGLFGAMVGSDPVAYLASEYIDGQTLTEMIEKKRAAGRAFSLRGTYNVVAHLCNALVYAHGATIHGGLTPDSVLVNSAGRVKVIDFGLARALGPLDAGGAGGLAVMPPEIATQPDLADARADVYSVGVILFELLTGRAPMGSSEPPSAVVPGIPRAVDEVVAICLSPHPDSRYPDAQALKEALHAALEGAMEPSQPGTPTPKKAPTPPPAVAAPPPSRPPAPPAFGSGPKPLPGGPPAPRAPATPAPVPASFNMDSALSAIDDTTERWLIQKDKLDFGPFNLRDVRSQVESGKILGEHTIVDTETGERRKVKDHPQLRQVVMEAEQRMAEQARLDAEAADKRRQRGKVVGILGAMFVLLAAGGTAGFFIWKRGQEAAIEKQRKEAELLAAQARAEEAAADFLKNAEITLKVDPPAPKSRSGGGKHSRRAGEKGAFSDVTNLGDASEGGGEETLDQSQVASVMKNNYKVLVGCILEERRHNPGLRAIEMEFIIKGTGNVSAVKVNGSQTSGLANCMYGKMQTVTFPKFNGTKTRASFSLNMK